MKKLKNQEKSGKKSGIYTARFFVIVLSLAICRDPPGGTPESSDPISEPATPGNETYQKLAKSENFLLNKIFKSNLRPFFVKNQKNGKKSIFFSDF